MGGILSKVQDRTFGPQPFPVPCDYTDGTKVSELPELSDHEKTMRRLKAENCPCPFLKTAYVQGKLNVNEVGYAPLQDCYAVMDWCGAGRSAFPTPAYFIKYGITGVPVLHLALNRPNDTGILHAYIGDQTRKERLDQLMSFANKHGHMDMTSFRRAVNHYVEVNKANKNSYFSPQGELVTLVTAFGQRCFMGLGRKYLTKKDVEDLWVNSKYPEGWLARRKPETSRFSAIDFMMAVRLIRIRIENLIDSLLGKGPKMFQNSKIGFKPRPNPPYSDVPGEPPMTKIQISEVPGNYEKGIALFDSRSGQLQDLKDGKEWDLNDHPEWWQTTVEDYIKNKKQS